MPMRPELRDLYYPYYLIFYELLVEKRRPPHGTHQSMLPSRSNTGFALDADIGLVVVYSQAG